MAERPLPTPDELRQLLRYDPETGKLYWRERPPHTRLNRAFNTGHAGKSAGSPTTHGYIQVMVNKRQCHGHRIAWAITHGSWPIHQIDHINGDRSDNRLSNLRDVPQADNMHNRGRNRNNRSGYANVSPSKCGWQASFKHRGEAVWVGHFKCPIAADLAVRAKQAELGYTKRHGSV